MDGCCLIGILLIFVAMVTNLDQDFSHSTCGLVFVYKVNFHLLELMVKQRLNDWFFLYGCCLVQVKQQLVLVYEVEWPGVIWERLQRLFLCKLLLII